MIIGDNLLQISQMKLSVDHTEADIKNKIIKELELRRIFKDMPYFEYKIIRRSIDARKKPEIYYIYSVTVLFKTEDIETTVLKKCRNKNVNIYTKSKYIPNENINHTCKKRPVIVGEGPAGLFCGLILAKAGLAPIILERGDKVEKRVEKVENFWLTGSVDENTNVQFGEGGAGTFSDGKLNTLVKDKSGMNQYVLDTFVEHGANPECSYDNKPHVGTDVLRDVVVNIRKEIINLGGNVLHLCKMTGLVGDSAGLKGAVVENMSGNNGILDAFEENIKRNEDDSYEILTDDLVLAVGHSARDTFDMLYQKGIEIEQKNFAIGVRIQHPQSMIDDSQYGEGHSDLLPPATYKVTNHTSNNRDVFSFCMCPGGYVVNASSLPGHVCVNGMSYSDRGSVNANSALICAIDRKDFGSDHPLSGMYLQEKLEMAAYNAANGNVPIQLFKDFCEKKTSEGFGHVEPTFKGNVEFANLWDILPEEICKALIESINKFGYTIEGFDDSDAILAAVESRTSSPIKIKRDENMQSSLKGLYPCGEGAGYAGGITSAAADGIRVAEAIIKKYMI